MMQKMIWCFFWCPLLMSMEGIVEYSLEDMIKLRMEKASVHWHPAFKTQKYREFFQKEALSALTQMDENVTIQFEAENIATGDTVLITMPLSNYILMALENPRIDEHWQKDRYASRLQYIMNDVAFNYWKRKIDRIKNHGVDIKIIEVVALDYDISNNDSEELDIAK